MVLITSASRLAANHYELNAWAEEVHLDPFIKRNIPSSAPFHPIRALQNASRRFPAWLEDPNSEPYSQWRSPSDIVWRNELVSALHEQGSYYQLITNGSAKGIPPNLQHVVPTIFRSCERHEELRGSKEKRTENEANLRMSLDGLADACTRIEGDLEQGLQYSAEKVMRPPFAETDNSSVSTIKPDAIFVHHIDIFTPYEFSPNLRQASRLIVAPLNPVVLDLVHGPCEFKRVENGENQAKMAMVSAMYRKALGVGHQFVFGVFQFGSDFLQVIAGLWEDDQLKIYQTGTYSLRRPEQVLQFYFVLYGIQQNVGDYKQELTDHGPVLLANVQANPPVSQWAD